MASASSAAVLVIVAGGGFAACDVVGRTILQRATPDAVLARVLGALEGVDFAGLAVGSLLAPLVVLLIGVQPTVIVFGLVLPAGITLAWAGLRAIDRHALVPFRAMALLREAAIFAPLPQPSLEWLARQTRWISIERGHVLIAEGDPGDAYYVLESGQLAGQPWGPADPDLRHASGRRRRDRPAPRCPADGHRHRHRDIGAVDGPARGIPRRGRRARLVA